MQSLKELYIENNSLISIPSSIKHLVQLEVLDFTSNRLTSLPKTLFELKSKLQSKFNQIKN